MIVGSGFNPDRTLSTIFAKIITEDHQCEHSSALLSPCLFRDAGYGEEREEGLAGIIEKYLHEHGK